MRDGVQDGSLDLGDLAVEGSPTQTLVERLVHYLAGCRKLSVADLLGSQCERQGQDMVAFQIEMLLVARDVMGNLGGLGELMPQGSELVPVDV